MDLNQMQDAVLRVQCKERLLLEKGATARVLDSLAEIDKRRLWVKEGYASLSSLSIVAPILTQENAKTILPEVVGKPVREVEKVVHKHFPERAVKKEKFEAELDDELKALLEAARKIAGEKNSSLLLKKI